MKTGALLVAFAALIVPAQPAAPAIGWITGLKGPWQANGAAVTMGQGLPAGTRLRLQLGPTDTDQDYSIRVRLLNNTALTCPSTPACRPGLTLPASLNAGTSLSSRVSQAFDLIFHKPERWVGLVSRGVPTEFDLPDAVLLTWNGRLAVGPLLKSLPAGDYSLLLGDEREGQESAPRIGISVKWTAAPPDAIPSRIPAGLYSVVLKHTGDPAQLGRDTWVLIAPDNRFRELHAAFDEALSVAKTWTDVPSEDVDRFLHAYLTNLSQSLK